MPVDSIPSVDSDGFIASQLSAASSYAGAFVNKVMQAYYLICMLRYRPKDTIFSRYHWKISERAEMKNSDNARRVNEYGENVRPHLSDFMH